MDLIAEKRPHANSRAPSSNGGALRKSALPLLMRNSMINPRRPPSESAFLATGSPSNRRLFALGQEPRFSIFIASTMQSLLARLDLLPPP